MLHQLLGISEGKEGEGDIEAAVLLGTADLVNQDSGVADGFIIGTDRQGRVETFDLEQVVSLEIAGDVLEDWQVRKFSDDQQVDAVAVVPKNIFCLEIQHMFVITQFDLHCASGCFVPVNTVSWQDNCFGRGGDRSIVLGHGCAFLLQIKID